MAERYKVYEQLGVGGVGAVYRAYDNELKRWVAIKRLISATEIGGDEKLAADLRREADALASLRNPNIVTIFDVASDAEGLFMVMELLEGEDLADVVARGPLHYDDFKELASQTVEALLAAHQRHILHRDIKPENIKVERLPGGRMQSKIIDFGLARTGLRARKQTEDVSGAVMGSIFYMAPEQLTRKPTDERTDLYSLGCVFYEALSGRKAFDGDTVTVVIDKHIEHDILPLHVIAPHVPPWLGAWVLRLMAQKPDDRPANAQLAIEEFRAWEKMSSAPPMMPWMPTYAPPPGAYTQPIYPGNVTTSSVPVHPMYYQTGQIQPVAYHTQPVEIIPVAEPIIEMGAHTAPLLPARPQVSAGNSQARTRSATPARSPTSHAATPKRDTAVNSVAKANPFEDPKIKKFALMAGSALVVLIGGWLILGGKSSAPTAAVSIAAPSSAATSEANHFQLPMDRPLPPNDTDVVLHLVSMVGVCKDAMGKPVTANIGDAALSWHDLAPRGKGNTLLAYSLKSEHAPVRQHWTNIGVKGGRSALDFRPRNGKPCAMEMVNAGEQSAEFPFGIKAVKGAAGLSLAIAFQAEATRLPTRVATLLNEKGARVSLLVVKDKNIVAEFDNGVGGKSSIVSKDVDGSKPSLVIITWDAATGDIILRVRDGSGKAFMAKGDSLPKPLAPLNRLMLGRIKDFNGKDVGSADQFAGWISEIQLASGILGNDKHPLWENSQLKDFYLGLGPSSFTDRVQIKLPRIDLRNAWKFTASHNSSELKLTVDGNTLSRWSAKVPQASGQWIRIELPSEENVAAIALDTESNRDDYPRGYLVETSTDGNSWTKAAEGKGSGAVTEIMFATPQKARHIRITQNGSDSSKNWGFSEILLFKK